MLKLDLEKAEEPEIKLPIFLDHRENKGIPEKNIYFCFIDYTKAFYCVDHNELWKILKEMGIPEYFTCLLRTCMQVKMQQLKPDMEQWTDLKLGKEHNKLYIIILFT